MSTYKITCKRLSSDKTHIDQVGLILVGSNSRIPTLKTPKEVNELIRENNQCFFTADDGHKVDVVPYGGNFIKTNADGTLENNLRHLPICTM